jgi:hypothetical protein
LNLNSRDYTPANELAGPIPKSARRWRTLGFCLLTPPLLALQARRATGAEGNEFFEQRIRPVLVDRCYQCHSAHSEKLKGGLHLDSREGALKGGDTRAAIVPGDPEKSLLIEAIRYGNPDLQMPPKKKLSEASISDFVSWIRLGAPWQEEAPQASVAKTMIFNLEQRRQQHWSWRPIQSEPPPSVQNRNWPASPVDQFILAKLEEAKLKPAPPADKRTLIRRAYFDLVGLPPAPRDIEAFLNDSSPSAFEGVTDRLLASAQFGERWARHWLDLVRYADTLGHEFDYPIVNAWRYRDYVIRAFNCDLPYNRFVTEQIAGDLLEKPRLNPSEGFNESVIGTGFFWLGQRSHSPVDVRQEEAEVVDNQIDVMAKTFLGLTVACARCHDHKFDAISTRDYYSLFGVLTSSRYAQNSIDSSPAFAQRVEILKALKQKIRPLIGAVWLEQASTVAAYLTAVGEVLSERESVSSSNRVLEVSSTRHLSSARLTRWVEALDSKEFAQPEHPLFACVRLLAPKEQSPSFEKKLRSVLADLPHPTSDAIDHSGVENFADFSAGDFAGWSAQDEAFGTAPSPAGDFVVGGPTRPVLALLTEPAANSACISRRLEGVFRSPTFTIQNRYAHILASGSGCRVNVRIDNFTMIRDPIYGGLKQPLDKEPLHWITIDLDTWKGHRAYFEFDDLTTPDPSDEAGKEFSKLAYLAVSRVILSEHSSPPSTAAPCQLLSSNDLAGASSLEQLSDIYQIATVAAVKAWMEGSHAAPAQIAWLEWLNRKSLLDGDLEDTAVCRLVAAVTDLRKVEDSVPDHARAIGMVDGTGLDENVFIHGNHKTRGEIAPRRFLQALGGSEERRFARGSGRLELADCLIDPSNPFLARVMVNRVWLHLFGRGIVPTPDDFGALGQPPTDPELLDWLADWYRNQAGWSTKKLIRLLMTSQTYRMSSAPSDAAAEEKDPQNQLFHRMPIRRLESEPIRDAILSISGQLDPEMFGPPVPVYLTEFMEGRGRPSSSGPLDGAGRRSIYQALRRNFLPPMMRAFDFPVPFTTIGRRTVSNVPAQSLILMNDPFVIGQAQAWAKSVLSKPRLSPQGRIQWMYQTIFARSPAPAEIRRALAFLDQQGQAYGLDSGRSASDPAVWSDFCQVLMNVKEFIFLN